MFIHSPEDPGTEVTTGSLSPGYGAMQEANSNAPLPTSCPLHATDQCKSLGQDLPLVGRTANAIIKGLGTGRDDELEPILISPTVSEGHPQTIKQFAGVLHARWGWEEKALKRQAKWTTGTLGCCAKCLGFSSGQYGDQS